MTLERRILISNLLMVLVPVLATALVALLCIVAIWHSLSLGQGFDGTDDLREAALATSAAADHMLSAADDATRASRKPALDTLLDKTGLGLSITSRDTGRLVYSHGSTEGTDATLLQAASALPDGSLVESSGRAVLVDGIDVRDDAYRLAFFGAIRATASYPQLKASVVAAAVLVLLTVFAASAFTSRIISRILVDRFQLELERKSQALATSNAELEQKGRELAESNAALERRDAARRQLVADISHDLRSPLTSIRGYAEGLLDGVATSPERQRHYLEVIRDKSVQVSELAEHVFSFSKLELDDYPVHLEDVRLGIVVRSAAERAEGDHAGQLAVTSEVGDVCARADAELLGRALSNVLGNSAKYRTGKVAHVRVTASVDDGRVLLDVADDGPGLADPSDAERIFDPFFRGDAARERPQDGSGLGLAFVARALELMGGTASARQGEPHGLVISLELLAASREGDKGRDDEESRATPVGEGPDEPREATTTEERTWHES